MGSKSQQSSKPSPETNVGSGVGLGYILGPDAANYLPKNPLFADGNQPFDAAGSMPGSILPDFGELQDKAGQSFFGGLSGDNPNPIFSGAMDTAFGKVDPETGQTVFAPIDFGVGQVSAGGGGGLGGFGGGMSVPSFGKIINPGAAQNALDTLNNPDSVFDVMSGGPIVDRISSMAEEQAQAVENQQLAPGGDLDQALSRATANLAGMGLLSHSTVMKERLNTAADVVRDLAVFRSTQKLDTTKYLGELAMSDVQNRTNAAGIVLQQALVEAGQDKALAASLAETAAANMRQAAALDLQAQMSNQDTAARLSMNNQNNALTLLGMGQQDFQTTKADVSAVDTLPFDLLGQSQGIPGISSGSSKSL